jgi:Zn-dependent peptidase ImmA (M78 family)
MSQQRRRNNLDTIKEVRRLLGENKVSGPAVPVERIANSLNLKIKVASYDPDLSGCLIRTPQENIIGVNVAHHENRQRFTVAHEIGHFLFHPGEKIFVDRGFRVNRRDQKSSTAEDPEEIEANRFASELLMPKDFLGRDLEKYRYIDIEQDELVRDLALRYRVSSQAMMYRLVNLGFLTPFEVAST